MTAIVTIGTSGTRNGAPGMPVYWTTKAPVEVMTRSLAREFGPQGVTSNIVSPGTIPDKDTDISTPRFQALLKANPVGRLGTADDIAAMVDLLVSEQGGFINGQMLQVNGGVVNQF